MPVVLSPRGVAAAAVVAVLVATLLAGVPAPAAAAESAPPDQLDPPAPGEGQPLDDPSEPEAPRPSSYAAAVTTGSRPIPRQAVEFIAGPNRFATSVSASRRGWPDTAPAAVLANGDDYGAALAAASLAGTVGGPLLLTPTGTLDRDVAGELQRLLPEVVYLAGPLADVVEQQVAGLGLRTERVTANGGRATVSWVIARRAAALGAETSTVLVASANDFPDALAASALGAGLTYPILLTPGPEAAAQLAAEVAALGAQRTLVVGGTAAVPDEAVAGLPAVERLAGPERTATAVVVADRARALGLVGRPVLASAESFPDGLSGGAFAGGARGAPVLLTPRGRLAEPLLAWLGQTGTDAVSIAGGPAAVAPLVSCQLQAGDERAFLCVEHELAHQGYHVGAVDGRVDHQTVWAVLAFQKVAGLPVTGSFGEAELQALQRRPTLPVVRPDLGPDHIEIDLARQLVLVVRNGRVAHALHTSTGKPSTPTVRGVFSVYEKRDYRQANRMYRPVFFYRGYAFHGYPEIPLHPASAGCARLYDGDMDFLWPMLQLGTRVASY
jgi:putative cell wall-binding protein